MLPVCVLPSGYVRGRTLEQQSLRAFHTSSLNE